MLSKQKKLQLRKYPEFFSQAKRLFNPLFTIFYNQNPDGFLITVVVPKKVASKATKRNRLRRVVYAQIEESYEKLEGKKLSVAIVLKTNSAKITENELKQEVLKVLAKL